MLKVTERGIESTGEPVELSEEDLKFIDEMFKEFSNYQKHPLEKDDDQTDNGRS